jgi:phosphoenolpyruvate-protein kinase (PTS system EI component)
MKRTQIASLIPGRVVGQIERDPTRSGSNKIMLLRQDQLGDLSSPPGGLILVEAALFSHPIIQWLGRQVPLALMDPAQAAQWERPESAVLDCERGEIRAAEQGAVQEPWHGPAASIPVLGRPVRMSDGTEIRLSASVAGATGVRHAIECGAASIGLVRSEYLLPENANRPTTHFYRRAFSELLALAEPLEVTIRLLDLAPDKWPARLTGADSGDRLRGLHGSQLFGFRVVRDLVDAQLEALATVEARERLRLIWPSGGRLEDFRRWRDSASSALPTSVALGAMVESPLEMLALDRWSTHSDFIAVGCNDLLQHLCAAERDDPQQRHFLDPYRPELFGFLGDAAQRAGGDPARLQLCGLLPQIERVLPVLVGLGYRCFSGEATLIPLLADCLLGSTLRECETLATEVRAAGTSQEVRELLGIPREMPWGLVRGRSADGGPGLP